MSFNISLRRSPTKFVDDQRRQRLAVQVFCDDEQRPPVFGDQFEQRQQIVHGRDFLLVHQDARVLELADHPLRIGDEIRRNVTAVELHALDDFEHGIHRAVFFDRDDPLLAHLLHGVGQDVADRCVTVRADGCDLTNFFFVARRLGQLLELGDDLLDRDIDAPFQVHRVVTRLDELETLPIDGLSQHRCSRRPVAGLVARPRGDLAHHLRAHIFELLRDLDFFGDGDTVLGDDRTAVGPLDENVTTARPQRHFDRIGEHVHAAQDLGTGSLAENDIFDRHENHLSWRSITAMDTTFWAAEPGGSSPAAR